VWLDKKAQILTIFFCFALNTAEKYGTKQCKLSTLIHPLFMHDEKVNAKLPIFIANATTLKMLNIIAISNYFLLVLQEKLFIN